MAEPIKPGRSAGQAGQKEQQAASPKELPKDGPDKFVGAPRRKLLALDVSKPLAPVKRGRTFDPRIIPLVPASVTTDPSRQFHALLGLPQSSKSPKPQPKQTGKPDIDALLASLSPARAKLIRQILSGENTRLRRALLAFIQDARFARLDFEHQRRALAAFDLRWP
jgi:hypothetical protein